MRDVMRRINRRIATRRKVADETGETLVEVLVSLLVSGLAMLVLSMAIAMSMNIITKGNETAQAYYASDGALAALSGDKESSTVTVVEHLDSAGVDSEVPVEYVTKSLPGGGSGVSYEAG